MDMKSKQRFAAITGGLGEKSKASNSIARNVLNAVRERALLSEATDMVVRFTAF